MNPTRAATRLRLSRPSPVRAGVLMILGGGLATLGAAGILARQIAPGMLDDLGHQASARLRWGNEMGILEAVRRLGRSFVGEFGWLDVRLPVAAYWVATALGLGLLGAVAARLVSVRRSRQGTMMGVLWVGTFGGLNRFDPVSETSRRFVHRPHEPDSLANDIVRALLLDRSGSVWVGTQGGGLDLLDQITGSCLHHRHDPRDVDSLSHDDVRALIEDDRGRIWIGTAGGGLDCLGPGELPSWPS